VIFKNVSIVTFVTRITAPFFRFKMIALPELKPFTDEKRVQIIVIAVFM